MSLQEISSLLICYASTHQFRSFPMGSEQNECLHRLD